MSTNTVTNTTPSFPLNLPALSSALSPHILNPRLAGAILGRFVLISCVLTTAPRTRYIAHGPQQWVLRFWADTCRYTLPLTCTERRHLLRLDMRETATLLWNAHTRVRAAEPGISELDMEMAAGWVVAMEGIRILAPQTQAEATEILEAMDVGLVDGAVGGVGMADWDVDGNRRAGRSTGSDQTLDIATMTEPAAESRGDEDCGICLTSMGENAVRLKACMPAHHAFCSGCLDLWVNGSGGQNTCPMCRTLLC